MCERSRNSTSRSERTGPFDNQFVYRLTEEGEDLLSEHERTNGRPAYLRTPCPAEVAEALDSEARRERQRLRQKEARARGVRAGTVYSRWRDGRYVPELRMTGRWLENAGFDQGQEYEVEVEIGKLTIQVV